MCYNQKSFKLKLSKPYKDPAPIVINTKFNYFFSCCVAVCEGTSNGLVARGDWKFRYERYKELYTNCTYLLGNLEVVFLDNPGKTVDLSFLSTIRQVTGYVLIVAVHADYVPLTSLQIIRGKTLFYWEKSNDYYSLFVALNYDKNSKTIGLKELRFTSLQGKGFYHGLELLASPQ